MEERTVQKPTAVVLIGWFGIIVSLIFLFLFIDELVFTDDLVTVYHPFSPTITFYFYIYDISYTIIFLISCINFLKLRMWARNAMEILSWIGIFDGVIFSIIMLKNRLVYNMMMQSDISYTVAGEVFLTSLILFVFVLLIAISIVIIYYLRSKSVRNAMIH